MVSHAVDRYVMLPTDDWLVADEILTQVDESRNGAIRTLS